MTFEIPDHTSINQDEYKPDAYVIPFAPELVGFIVDNLKLTTYRFGKKYDYLKVGDTVSIQNSLTKDIVGSAVIKKKSETTLKELPLNNNTHESYKDKEHQRQVLSGYYAYVGRPLEDEDDFLVFDFELTDAPRAAA